LTHPSEHACVVLIRSIRIHRQTPYTDDPEEATHETDVDPVYNPNVDAPRTPKLTYFRLLNVLVVGIFGVAKAVFLYLGATTVPSTLDWVFVTLLVPLCVHLLATEPDGFAEVLFYRMYYLSLYEEMDPPMAPWFFQTRLFGSHAVPDASLPVADQQE
jgi:hypothetical protein